MYYIRKYSDCWTIHNDATDKSRPLTEEEKELRIKEYPRLVEPNLWTLFVDEVDCIEDKP